MRTKRYMNNLVKFALLGIFLSLIPVHEPLAAESADGTQEAAHHRHDRGNRPNILFIMSDDHASQAVSAYGGALAEIAPTPNIDRLADGGVRFDNAFVTNSICTPSRAVTMTGKYSHVNGVYKFTGLDQSQPTLPKYMQEHGYQTGFVGKYHLLTNPVGFDNWSILPGQGLYHDTEFVEMGDEHPSGIVEKGKRTRYQGWHSTDIITEKALEWFKNVRDPERPFFYMLHYKAPHDLWENAARYDTYLEDVKIPEPDTLFDHGSGRSLALDHSEQDIGGTQHHTLFNETIRSLPLGKERRRLAYQEYMKRYLRCVKGIDDNIGKVLDYLDSAGLAENTIIVYTSDQGFFLGEHGLYDKRFIYEESLRIPLLVRWPQHTSAGSTVDEIVLNLDFAPTFLDLVGHRVPEDMQGTSFRSLLVGQEAPEWRDAFYYRYYLSHFNTPSHFGLRTNRFKLAYFDAIGVWELYDLEADPGEMRNLANDPERKDVFDDLRAKLVALQSGVGDDPADIGDNPRTGNPALDRWHEEKYGRRATN